MMTCYKWMINYHRLANELENYLEPVEGNRR